MLLAIIFHFWLSIHIRVSVDWVAVGAATTDFARLALPPSAVGQAPQAGPQICTDVP